MIFLYIYKSLQKRRQHALRPRSPRYNPARVKAVLSAETLHALFVSSQSYRKYVVTDSADMAAALIPLLDLLKTGD